MWLYVYIILQFQQQNKLWNQKCILILIPNMNYTIFYLYYVKIIFFFNVNSMGKKNSIFNYIEINI